MGKETTILDFFDRLNIDDVSLPMSNITLISQFLKILKQIFENRNR
jgi:hypothetical protein